MGDKTLQAGQIKYTVEVQDNEPVLFAYLPEGFTSR